MYRLRHLLIPPGRIVPCRQHVRPKGYPNKEIGENVDQSRGGAYGSKRVAPAEAPHHDDIHRVEHELKDTGQHQGKRK